MTSPLRHAFAENGWLRFSFDRAVADWATHALSFALESVSDPAHAHWLRCGGTWFVGVDALPNDAEGRVGGGPALGGAVMDFLRGDLGIERPLHPAQVSVCYHGYPKPYDAESETAYNYRLKRDAAHVDGLHGEGPARRRFLKEPHAYILGLPLNETDPRAAPLTVWSGSHRIMTRCFEAVYGAVPPERWPELDVTGAYQAARRECFETCERVALPVRPGEATLLHRHLLHGVAPWPDDVPPTEHGRIIAYFRPEWASMDEWLRTP